MILAQLKFKWSKGKIEALTNLNLHLISDSTQYDLELLCIHYHCLLERHFKMCLILPASSWFIMMPWVALSPNDFLEYE